MWPKGRGFSVPFRFLPSLHLELKMYPKCDWKRTEASVTESTPTLTPPHPCLPCCSAGIAGEELTLGSWVLLPRTAAAVLPWVRDELLSTQRFLCWQQGGVGVAPGPSDSLKSFYDPGKCHLLRSSFPSWAQVPQLLSVALLSSSYKPHSLVTGPGSSTVLSNPHQNLVQNEGASSAPCELCQHFAAEVPSSTDHVSHLS